MRKKLYKIALDFVSPARHIRRCISGYVPVDVTQQAGQKTSKMCNYFFRGPKIRGGKINGRNGGALAQFHNTAFYLLNKSEQMRFHYFGGAVTVACLQGLGHH